jgi:hypothetical protein
MFKWAKSLITSEAWKLILKDRETDATITFCTPQACPGIDLQNCSIH